MNQQSLIYTVLFILLVPSTLNVFQALSGEDWLGAISSTGVMIFLFPSPRTISWIHSRFKDNIPIKQWVAIGLMLTADLVRVTEVIPSLIN